MNHKKELWVELSFLCASVQGFGILSFCCPLRYVASCEALRCFINSCCMVFGGLKGFGVSRAQSDVQIAKP